MYRLYGFKPGDRSIAERYAELRSRRTWKGDRLVGRDFRLVAVYSGKRKLTGWNLYAVGSSALIERCDLTRNEIIYYFRKQPEDKTRLSYLIGEYNMQECISWEGVK